jgi:hypothetical protein
MNKLEVEVEATKKETLKTIAMYKHVVRGLARHSIRMKSQDPLIVTRHPGVLLAIACRDVEPVVPESSASLKLAAAIYAIKNWTGFYDIGALEMLCPEPSESESDRQDRVLLKRANWNSKSSGKAREPANNLPTQHWKRVIDAILVSKSKWAIAASDWLSATLVTGLRPADWRKASLNKNLLSITAVAFDDEKEVAPLKRTIELACTDRELQCVQRFLNSVKNLDDQSFDLMYEGVRALTRTVGHRTFPEWGEVISIDAARQTALAIMKLSSHDSSDGDPKPQTSPGPEWSRALRAQAALFEDLTKSGD